MSSGTVSVVRKDGASFSTNPVNIGQERDFYRLAILSLEDEDFARKMIDVPGANPSLVKLNMGWLDTLAAPSRLRRLLQSRSLTDDTLEKAIRDVEIQAEENLHSRIEGPAKRHLEYLRAGDSGFWHVDTDARDFAFFVSLQHLRTKAMRERVLNVTDSRIAGQVERTWPILRLAFATNIGWSLYSDRARWQIRMLSAAEELRFITGDQPILNLLPQTGNEDDLALYYPVSPEKAALLQLRGAYSPIGSTDQLTDEIVEDLNRQVVKGIHEQAFGIDLPYLKRLMGCF
jgi:hypothetical protein